jgi:predicted alpha/beta hydrolase
MTEAGSHRDDLTVRGRDGVPLAADLLLPDAPPRAAVLVASAMGVPRGYYGRFAAFLARGGLAALTLDYRGVGGSRDGPVRRSRAVLHEWAEQDLAGALDFLAARIPGVPILWVGHSVGGQLLGLVDDPRIQGALLVAAQSGHWRLWSGTDRLRILALWYAVIPLLVPLLGRLPAAILGGGEDVPAGVAREWAEWGRKRDYAVSYARPRGGRGFARFRGPIVSYAIADDVFAPVRAVEALLGSFEAARGELRVVAPRELGERAIGHFGFFRPRFEPTLWREAAEWLGRAAEQAARERPGAR